MSNISSRMAVILEEIDESDHSDDYDDNKQCSSKFTQHGQPRPSLRFVEITRYFLLATITILLTVTCPGNTQLWDHHSKNATTNTDEMSTEDTIKLHMATQLLVVYVLSILMFVIVHCSNPGFLTKEILDHLQEIPVDGSNATTTDDANTIEMTHLSWNCDDLQHYYHNDDVRDVESTKSAIRNHNEILGKTKDTNQEEHDDTVSLLLVTTATKEQQMHRRSKYCITCDLQPLVRSHHCKICQRCVATFDHHCVFMGVCIGERNRCKFYVFLLLQTIGFYLCTNIIATSSLGFSTIIFPVSSSASSSSSSSLATTNHFQYIFYCDAIRVVIAKLYVYTLTFIAYIMLGLHTFFAFTNLTTFECTKGPKHLDYLENTEETMDLPFYRGIVQNLYHCCMSDDICNSSSGLGIHSKQRLCRQKSPLISWTPTIWKKPGPTIRDSPDWWNHPWKNKYWSCC